MTDNIDLGQLSEAINDKMDRDANNAEDALRADYVIDYQAPTAENNYTWYRLYRSRWVEQGGFVDNIPSGTAGVSITFPKEMADTDYFSVPAWGSADYAALASGVRSTNGMKIFNRTNGANWCRWEVKDMSAQS